MFNLLLGCRRGKKKRGERGVGEGKISLSLSLSPPTFKPGSLYKGSPCRHSGYNNVHIIFSNPGRSFELVPGAGRLAVRIFTDR